MLQIKQESNLAIVNKDQCLNVSLEKIILNSTIRSMTANVNITQIFRNNENSLIETVYYFPITKSDRNYQFTIYIDEQKIVTQTKTKDNLFDNNNQFENDTYKQDYFKLDIGPLLPSKQCQILIDYITKLDFIDQSIVQFIVPTFVHKFPLKTNLGNVQFQPYTVEFNCTIEQLNEQFNVQQEISKVTSTSHSIQVDRIEENILRVTFIEQNTYLNKDIIINIQLANPVRPPKSTNREIASNSNERMPTQEGVLCIDCHNTSVTIPTRNSVGQPFDYYCILDFEAVCHQINPNLKRPAPNDIWEIIEFPICLLESETNEIIDIYHSYVRPTIQSQLNEKCIHITGITQDTVDKSPTFDIVWIEVQRFLAKHSLIHFENNIHTKLRSFTWITCGNWDLRTMLPLQLKQSGLKQVTFIKNFINLKELYNEYYPKANIRGMKDMLFKLNLKLEGQHHSGIDDTKNITRIVQWFIQNNKILKLTEKKLFCSCKNV